jgi:hypothetical protein
MRGREFVRNPSVPQRYGSVNLLIQKVLMRPFGKLSMMPNKQMKWKDGQSSCLRLAGVTDTVRSRYAWGEMSLSIAFLRNVSEELLGENEASWRVA